MKKRHRLARLLAALPALLLAGVSVVGCSGPKGGAGGGFGGGGGSSSGPLKVGLVGNFSGPASYVGNGMLNGAQFAADVLNERRPPGVLGRKIELIKCDVQFSESTAINCLTKLTSVDNVDVVMIDTPLGLDALGPEKTAELKVPVLLPSFSPPGIDEKKTPNVVSFGPPIDDDTDPQVLAEYLAQQSGKRRIGLIYSDDEFFTQVKDAYEKALKNAGVTPVASEKFTISDVDMSAQVRNLQKADVDTVVCLGLGADCARVAQGMERAGFHAQLAGTSAFYMRAFRELAKTASNDAVFTLPHGQTNDVSPAFIQWLFDYFRRYGFKTFSIGGSVSPDYPGLEFPSYQALDIYAKAAKDADSTEPAKVLAAFHRSQGFKSVGITHRWPAGSAYAEVSPPTEPWVTRFVNGHISWDLDKRSVPALEEARIAWEDRMFRGSYETDMDFALAAIKTMREELEKRKDALVAAEGQAKYDERVDRLAQAQKVVEDFKKTGQERELPELG